MKVKDEIRIMISDYISDFIDGCTIESEGYPHNPYISGCGDGEDELILLLDSINIKVGNNKKIADIFKPREIEDIAKEINFENIFKIDELEEVETINDYESEPKYNYQTIIFEYLNSNKFYSVTMQKSRDNEVDIELIWNGAVNKKEVISYEWI